MRILMITAGYPTPEQPGSGIFIRRQVEALRELGIEIDVLSFRSKANPLNHLKAWLEMHRMMNRQRYDLIHAQFGHAGLVACAQPRLPVVITYRGDDLQGIVGKNGRYTLKGSVLTTISQLLSKSVQQVIVVSERLGQRLPRRDYTVIPSGLDLDLFYPMPCTEARLLLNWELDKRVVLFCSLKDDPVKRYWLAAASTDLVREHLGNALEFRVVSGIPPTEIPIYLNASDVLLLTSLHEGSPNAVKEALACNLPVVSVDVGDVAERLAGVTPSAVCEAEPSTLAEALLAILRNPVRCNGRENVAELAEPLLAQRVIEVYHKALGTKVE
ncbi:MAG: glycosyltransferase [Anaerolineae bacterium]|nr:glycosyltransferase [Anaerolineae bacterium]